MAGPGRPPGAQNKDKPYRDALRMEAVATAEGYACDAPKGSLRWIARQQLMRAGEDTSAAKEIADRLDGRVPQAIVGDDEHDAISIRGIAWLEKTVSSASTTDPGINSSPSTTEPSDGPAS